MMTISAISNNVQQLLLATGKFVTVLPASPTEEETFAGYPAASHYYVDAVSDYATVSQNRRVLQYVVELYIVPNSTAKESDVLTQDVYPLIDAIMQLFDTSIDLSSESLGLSRACDIMRPSPSELIPVISPEGKGWKMTIRLFCDADISFR